MLEGWMGFFMFFNEVRQRKQKNWQQQQSWKRKTAEKYRVDEGGGRERVEENDEKGSQDQIFVR